MRKNAKLTKGFHAFKGYVSSYNVEILNYFNPDLQLKDTESAIKNKLTDLLTGLKGFKFMTTIVLEFKKIESGDKTKYDTLNSYKSNYTTIKSNIQNLRKRLKLDY